MNRPKLTIVKIGGKLIEDKNKLQRFLSDFSQLKGMKILVHGGGNMATDLASRLGMRTEMVNGRRITGENELKVILMTYAGLINKGIVAQLQGLNTNAIGLCGADGKSILSKKRKKEPLDFGLVGDIENINCAFISDILRQGITPVFSAVSCTTEGELLNTNADAIAGEIAKAMGEHFEAELFYLFEKKGVLQNVEDQDSVIEFLDKQKYESMLEEKAINEGMLPKLQNCFEALEKGLTKIYLGNEELLSGQPPCTQIVK